MMRRHRTDTTQEAIVSALKELGASVAVITQGTPGIGDILVGFRGRDYQAEIKSGPIGWKYTDAQKRFHSNWKGNPVLTFTSVEDALLWVHSVLD